MDGMAIKGGKGQNGIARSSCTSDMILVNSTSLSHLSRVSITSSVTLHGMEERTVTWIPLQALK